MKHLDLTVFEPGDMVGTISRDGKVAIWSVDQNGGLVASDNRLFGGGLTWDDGIEALNLSVRAYNVLKREGIHTIGKLLTLYSERGSEGLDDMRNMGSRSRDEIVAHVQRLQGEPTGVASVARLGYDDRAPDRTATDTEKQEPL